MTLSAATQVPLLTKYSNTFHDLSSVLFSTLRANPQSPKFRPWWYHGKSMSLIACKTELLTATGDLTSARHNVWNQDKLGNSLNWMQSEKLKDSSGTQSAPDFRKLSQKQPLKIKNKNLKNPHQKSNGASQNTRTKPAMFCPCQKCSSKQATAKGQEKAVLRFQINRTQLLATEKRAELVKINDWIITGQEPDYYWTWQRVVFFC